MCHFSFKLRVDVNAEERAASLPDGWSISGWPRLIKERTLRQILVQVSALHVLSDHTEGIAAHTHPEEADDVRILQPRQDLYLFQEVVPAEARARKEGNNETTWAVETENL